MYRLLSLILAVGITAMVAGFGALAQADTVLEESLAWLLLALFFCGIYLASLPVVRRYCNIL